jgi:hypothetical protein
MTISPSDDRTPAILDFESLFINNPELDQIGAYLKRFNPIKTMGMQHMEIRHSAILGWLMDPQESHGMGDQFLKAFLAAALSSGTGEHKALRALEVSQADIMDAEVRREWRSIDLLVISRTNGWVFIIENKFHSKQHGNQLKDYYQKVEDAFGGDHKADDQSLDIHGIFLILHDEEPQDPRYATIQYKDVLVLLKRSIDDQVRPLSPEVKIFIQHYVEVIEEATDMDDAKNDMVTLARQLYRDHKKVLDFVVEHGTGNDFSFACDTVFGADLNVYDEVTIAGQKFVYNHTAAAVVSFLPKSWYDAFGADEYYWHGCKNWWAELPVICWMQLIQGDEKNGTQLRLYAEIGPLVEHDFRKGLIEGIIATAASKGLKSVSFQRTAANEGKKYSKFLNRNTINIDDANDSEEIAAGMETLLKRFQPTFDALAETMGKFVDFGKEEEL